MSFYHFKVDELPVPTKAEEKPKAEVDKKSNVVNKPAKTARKVGDVHPKHPTWIWTEYTKGKFDWRTNPANKKQGQRTDLKKIEIMDDNMILEAAYLAGFEPSSDDIPAHKEVQEAIEFLTIKNLLDIDKVDIYSKAKSIRFNDFK